MFNTFNLSFLNIDLIYFAVFVVPPTGLTCGQPTVQPSVSLTRIVGGSESVRNSWPWQCLLIIDNEDAYYPCGGSIIGPRHILTAAHCV